MTIKRHHTVCFVLLAVIWGCSNSNKTGSSSESEENTGDDSSSQKDDEKATEAAEQGIPTDTAPVLPPLDLGTRCDWKITDVPTDLPQHDATGRPTYDAGVGDVEYREIFDPEAVPSFYLEISEALIYDLSLAPRTYVPGNFRYVSADGGEDITVKNVGIRLKGNWTFQPIYKKSSFKVRFDKYVDEQYFKGLARLTLNNMYQDPSVVRERLAYLVYRESGVTASLCNHAKVYLNGEFYGLYANVQSIDESFLAQHFAIPDGDLYDTVQRTDRDKSTSNVDLVPGDSDFFEQETNGDEKNSLQALISLLDGPQNTFYEDVKAAIDMDVFLTSAAVQTVIADWDAYCGNSNNYKFYQDVESELFMFFPWGTDQTFNIWGYQYDKVEAYGLDHTREVGDVFPGVIFTKCKADIECYSDYLKKVEAVVRVFENLNLEAELNGILNQVTPLVYQDVRLQCLRHRDEEGTIVHSIEKFEESVNMVRQFIQTRANVVRQMLDGGVN